MREEIAPGIYVEGDGSVVVDRDIADPNDIEEVRGLEEEEIGRRRNRDRGNRKSLRDRFSDARQKSLSNRQERSEDREERRNDRREDREDRRDDREDGRNGNGNGGSMGTQTVVEIASATNSGAAAADVEANVLIQYKYFKVKRIIDNGSGAGTRIKQIWSGKQLLVDYSTTGIVSTMFATNSNYITNQSLENLVFEGGRNLKVVMNVGAGLTGSLLFEGEAPVMQTLCG